MAWSDAARAAAAEARRLHAKPKLAAKPWNDPWNKHAMKDQGYKQYTYGTHAAKYVSWRRLSKAAGKVERGLKVHGRVERAVARVIKSHE